MGNIDLIMALKRAWDIFRREPLKMVLAFLIVAAICLTVFLGPLALAGFFIFLRKVALGERAEVLDVLQPFSEFSRYFLAGIIWLVAQMLIMLLISVMPWIISGLVSVALTGFLLMYMPLVALQGRQGYDALMDCVAFFKQRWPMAVALAVLINILQLLGWMAMGVGLLVTMPYSLALIYAAYEQVYGADDSGSVHHV